ncbi:MAG: hypothetical protein LBI85_08025 [Spirochaetaceae bacterium]|jgi:hypothetical protein|nr:hypothetical protein [Spirochaetaceae bacterium]
MGLLRKAARNESGAGFENHGPGLPGVSPVTDQGLPDRAGDSGIEDFVSTYYRDKGPFRGLVLTGGGAGILTTISAALSSGRITELTPGICLMLYPKPLNEKLIVHRLTESFGIKVIFCFEASGIAEALNHIKKYRPA